MKNFLRVTFNQRTQVLLVITLFIALLFMLGVWSSLSMVKAVDGSPIALDNTSSWVGYQVSGTLTNTMYMPFVRRDPTPTATKSPIIFFDDFSNANSGWIKGESGDCKFEYRDGYYRITVKDDNGVRCVSFNTLIPKTIDGIFSVSVRRTTSSDRELRYGFYFGAGAKAEEDRWFLEVEPHKVDCDGEKRGFFWVSAIEDGNTKFFHARCTSSVRTNTNDWNHLKVVRNGRDIAIYINGDHKEDYDKNVLRDKGFFDLVAVGVSDISDSRPGIVEFDNFLIERLP